MSLRRILYTMSILMTILPLLLFTISEYGGANNRMIEVRQAALQEFAYSEGQEIIRVTEQLKSQLWAYNRVITAEPEADYGDPITLSRARDIMADAVFECGNTLSGAFKVSGIYLIDSDGVVLVSSDDGAVNSKLESRSLSALLNSDGFFMTPITHESALGLPSGVWVSRSVGGDRNLAAFINAEVFENRLSRLRLDQTGHAFLVGGDGTLRTQSDFGGFGTYIDDPALAPLVKNYAAGTAPVMGYGQTAAAGKKSVFGYYVLPELESYVLVIQDTAEVLSPNRDFLFEAVLTSALFAVLSFVLFIPFIKRNIIVPISRLRKSMALASEGKYQHCELDLKNEVGALAEGFNHMVDRVNTTFTNLQSANAALREAEDRLKTEKERILVSELRFKQAADISTIAVFELTLRDNKFFCSDSWEKITSYPPMDIFPKDYVVRYIVHADDRRKLLHWESSDKATRFDEEIRFLTNYGEYKWLHIIMTNVVEDGGKTDKIIGSITDIHESVAAKQKATHAAYYDTLTDLPRRTLFSKDIDRRLDKINGTAWGAVYLISLDKFKQINDIYGFMVGDKTIISIACELGRCFSQDMYLARNSGNSFLLYGEYPRISSYVHETCEKIVELFKTPFVIDELSIEVPVHVGAAMYPDHGHDVNELIRNADIAMYEARGSQLAECYSVFNSDMLYKVERTHQVMEVLRNFEESKAMYIQYQPIVRASDRSCLGFEALVRMDTSPIGFISPVEFIPLAEQSKLIIPIGKAVLKESCTRAKELIDSGYEFDHISVNVSSVQLSDPAFVDTVLGVLEQTGLPNEKLQIEVTESMMIEHIEDSIMKLDRLRNSGISVALDDFGTGYSSMKYLRSIPLDVIKIDKHFIDELDQGMQKLFAFTMIQLAHDIGLAVVAEGVESERQFSLLRKHGCDFIQGYNISRPIYSHDIESFLDNYQREISKRA
ncbi:MAG: EAL domain-containing protein [Oscillospiraceae bacterium]|nr:EAL domain-containing protein [Oscillospiraceae bacterium]